MLYPSFLTIKTIVLLYDFKILQFGAATTIDILSLNSSNRRIVIRCPSDFYVKLRSALTIATHYESHDCYYKVIKASPCLLALSTDSRKYTHLS